MRNFFLGDITEKRRSTNLASFQKLCPGIKTQDMNFDDISSTQLAHHWIPDVSAKKDAETSQAKNICQRFV